MLLATRGKNFGMTPKVVSGGKRHTMLLSGESQTWRVMQQGMG